MAQASALTDGFQTAFYAAAAVAIAGIFVALFVVRSSDIVTESYPVAEPALDAA